MRAQFDNSPPSAGAPPEEVVVVLKYGSSVLRTRDDLPDVVRDICRRAREGVKIVAVVSAFAGETDALIAEARAAGAGASSRHAPRLVALGEERSAVLLAIACEMAGLNARILCARGVSLEAGGPVDDALPRSIDLNALRDAIAKRDVVIVPGFVALGEEGETVLLGRGGSDLTAVFIASALGLHVATLVKDVDGVYDRDPTYANGAARRYRRMTWAEARAIAGKLLQPKAIDFAASRGVAIRVLRLNGDEGTLVGDAPPADQRSGSTQPRRASTLKSSSFV
jgi:homoserine dehydrogenase